MAKKITQYPASGGNPEGGSLIDISELISGVYTSKKLTIDQLLDYLTANLNIGSSVELRNNFGTTVVAGTPMQISGYNGTVAPTGAPPYSSGYNNGKLYVAQNDILNGAIGTCVENGIINHSLGFVGGTKVYWNTQTETFTQNSGLDDNIMIGIILSPTTMFVSPRYTPSIISGGNSRIPLFTGMREIKSSTHFTYVDNVGTEVGFTFDDGVNNLTKVGVTFINVESEGIASNSVLRLANWADNTNKGIISFRKSKGTKAIPLKVTPQDVLGTLIFAGQADKIIDGTTTVPSGMTTAEIVVRAMSSFIRNYDSWANETFANGFTQYEIWLQGSNQDTFFDATPPNTKVFTVDGNGKLSLINNKLIFELDSFLRSVLSIGGQSRLTYMETDALLVLQSVGLNTSLNINAQGDLNYAQINMGKSTTAGDFALNNQTVLKISTVGLDFIEVIATEDGSISSHGSDVILRSYKNVNYGSGQIEVLRLCNDGRLQVSNSYKLPISDGSTGQVLKTDGAGNVAWASSSATTDIWRLSPNEVFRGLQFNNNSTTVVVNGGVVASTSASTLAKSVSSTSLIGKNIGLSYYATVVSTGRYTGTRGTANLWFLGGGFRFVGSFNISDTAYNAGCRQFYGMQGSATTADLTYSDTILVASLQNCIGVGSDALDANLQIFTNDNVGTCTKIDLGAGFPANRTAGTAQTTIYEVQLYNPSGQTNVWYRVENKETGALATGILSSDLPLLTQGLNFFASRCMGTALTNSGQFILTGQYGVYSTN